VAERLTCPECDQTFKTERGREGHIETKHPVEVVGTVAEETEKAIAAATHLGPMHAGSLAVLRRLARVIDGMDDAPTHDSAGKPLPFDNVTIPTYLKYAMQLGLTPVSAEAAGAKKEAPGGSTLKRLRQGAHLHSVEGAA
jgi:hypothetical protein